MRTFRHVLIAVLLIAIVGGGIWYVGQRRDPIRMLREAETALAAEQYSRVEGIAIQLDESGQRELAALLRGQVAGRQERYEAMFRILGEIPLDSPLFPDAARIAGLTLVSLQRHREARPLLLKTVAAQPDSVDAWRGLAIIDYDLGRMADAVEHLKQVARLDPADGKCVRLIALINKDLDQPQRSVEAYRQALERELPPTMRDEALLEFGDVLIKQQQYDEAQQQWAALSADARKTAGAAELQAELALATKSTDEALPVIDTLLGEHPQDATLLRLRAKLARSKNDLPAAIRYLEQAAKSDPAEYRIPYDLAQVYELQGNPAKAQDAKLAMEQIQARMERMTQLTSQAMERPDDAQVRVDLATTARELGKPLLAERWLKAATQIQGK